MRTKKRRRQRENLNFSLFSISLPNEIFSEKQIVTIRQSKSDSTFDDQISFARWAEKKRKKKNTGESMSNLL